MIVPILNLKGGTSKTTSAIALATAAIRDGVDVKVLDADPQSSASTWADKAEDDEGLPFEVQAANISTVKNAGKNYSGDPHTWVFIDCPPNGRVVDEAVVAADIVVISTTTSPIDLAKTYEAAETLSNSGIFFTVLITKVDRRTKALEQTVQELNDLRYNYIETSIPLREAIRNYFGNAFGDDLYGYQEVFRELKEAVTNGD